MVEVDPELKERIMQAAVERGVEIVQEMHDALYGEGTNKVNGVISDDWKTKILFGRPVEYVEDLGFVCDLTFGRMEYPR